MNYIIAAIVGFYSSLSFGLFDFITIKYCNRNDNGPARAAIGYLENGNWVSRGWWHIGPGECHVVHRSSIAHEYYFFYAETLTDEPRSLTDEDLNNVPFCTKEGLPIVHSFKLTSVHSEMACSEAGGVLRQFSPFKINLASMDTRDSLYTYTLSF